VEVRQIIARADREFRYPDELWVKTIYEFAAAYHRSVINRDHLLQALTPLYRGRVSSLVLENSKADTAKLEQRFELLGQEFEKWKPYLIDRWTMKAGGEQ
jgi:hypothetical protein